MKKSRKPKHKPPRSASQTKKSRRTTRRAKPQITSPKLGLGSEIAALFRGIGLKEGEEFPELRGFTIKPADFSNH